MNEHDISGQIRSFLCVRGWRSLRMQRTVVAGKFQTGEPGIPDFLFLRYQRNGTAADALWVEIKKPSAFPYCRCFANLGTRKRCTACDQGNWKRTEIARGAVVVYAENLEEFASWYRDSFQC